MAEHTIAHVEQMEKSHQELRELLMKNPDEDCQQMGQMMDIIIKMSQGKGITDDSGSMKRSLKYKWS